MSARLVAVCSLIFSARSLICVASVGLRARLPSDSDATLLRCRPATQSAVLLREATVDTDARATPGKTLRSNSPMAATPLRLSRPALRGVRWSQTGAPRAPSCSSPRDARTVRTEERKMAATRSLPTRRVHAHARPLRPCSAPLHPSSFRAPIQARLHPRSALTLVLRPPLPPHSLPPVCLTTRQRIILCS